LTTKIHALVDVLGNPVEVTLSAGQDHDLTCAEPLIEAVDPGALIAEKAFNADPFIAALNDRAIAPVILSKSNRKTPRASIRPLLRTQSHRAFFDMLKHFLAIATRYDKLAKTFLAGVHLLRLSSHHHPGRMKRRREQAERADDEKDH
jgi:transposase